jgi:threonine aldolase
VAQPIDFRSDTVTKPTEAMRRAMAEAEVGDDWYGDDPTVNRLQDRCAEITGKEGAVYVATGTMANQIAIHVLAKAGHTVVCEATAHVRTTESTSSATMSGVSYYPVTAPRGQLTAELVAAALEPDPYGVDVVDALALENTHQVGGGTVMPVDEMRTIGKVAREAGVPVYLDGARIFNAAAVAEAQVSDYTNEVDAVMFCLSKGLGAPIGSVLCGTKDFIEEARRVKILFGGAWRQAGIMAAAGLVALDEGPKRLHEDHDNARRLAQGIAEATPGCVDPRAVETNMVFVDAAAIGRDPWDLHRELGNNGVLANVVAGKVRLVTHRDVSAAEIEEALDIWPRAVRDAAGGE